MEKLTRKEQKEKTREALVQEATVLFAKQGIVRTTTAEVAQALQVSHGTVFLHFPTREDLIRAVVERFGERLAAEMGRRFSDDLDLKPLLAAHLLVLAEFEDFYFRLVTESHLLAPEIRGLVYAMNASLSYRFYRAAQRLMKAGEIKKMEQVPFFTAWMALVQYHVMNRDLLSEKVPILQYKAAEILKTFLFLLQAKEKK